MNFTPTKQTKVKGQIWKDCRENRYTHELLLTMFIDSVFLDKTRQCTVRIIKVSLFEPAVLFLGVYPEDSIR